MRTVTKMAHALSASIPNQVKLVVWDLDETLWNGTLSEEGISSVEAHLQMVRDLVDRGIMCSICSKNDFEDAKAALVDLDIWDYFVFPHIAWSPKGQAIKAMIAAMGLRDENVLFLDDNHLNLEEAQFFNPNVMVFDANQDILPLMDLPTLAGKDDKSHSRLKQYKVMEEKQVEQAETGLSNIDFLRQSEIRVKVITDVEDQMDRVYEILNRTNQLNYTKKRANTPAEKAQLQTLLNTAGVHAGLIEVQDRYGDYGVVGFFCVSAKYSGNVVHHLAFSCRTLNMGVEQWVWQFLNKPDFKTVGGVANPIDAHENVDWIQDVKDFDAPETARQQQHLCLVGGCDLLQVSFYCGTDRDEFVNKPDDNGMLVRFDDVGFFLNQRDPVLNRLFTQKNFIGYGSDDMVALDKSLASSDLILLSMYFSFANDLLFQYRGKEPGSEFLGSVPPRRFQQLMRDQKTAMRFAKSMQHRPYDIHDRLDLTHRCFQVADVLRRADAPIFIIGTTVRHGPQAERNPKPRIALNDMCRKFCAETHNAHFIDIDTLLTPAEFTDSDHYSRTGYFKIADFVNSHTMMKIAA